MGGKALLALDIQVDRIEGKELYERLCDTLCDYLKEFYSMVEALPQVVWKESFGDIDILVCDPIKPFQHDTKITRGTYTSFLHKDGNKKYQVDLILVTPSTFAFGKLNLFSDMSACLGGICKKMNLKFSHDGLWFCGKEIGNKLLLTDQVEIFLSFLGLPKDLPYKVDSYNTFFAYLLQCKFDLATHIVTSYEQFLENPYLKGLHRKSRNFKNNRQCFVKFVTYCKEHITNNQYCPFPLPEECISFFGEEKMQEYKDKIHALAFHEAFREKCNGKRFQRLLALEKKALGDCIEGFIAKYGKETILEMKEENLDELIVAFASLFQEKN
jgi:hypothetical protein